jgi:hypothetical protein
MPGGCPGAAECAGRRIVRGRGMMDLVTSHSPGQQPLNAGFAERLLEVIDSGRRTATYKLALPLPLPS